MQCIVFIYVTMTRMHLAAECTGQSRAQGLHWHVWDWRVRLAVRHNHQRQAERCLEVDRVIDHHVHVQHVSGTQRSCRPLRLLCTGRPRRVVSRAGDPRNVEHARHKHAAAAPAVPAQQRFLKHQSGFVVTDGLLHPCDMDGTPPKYSPGPIAWVIT